jgi:hypothetical protein
MLEGERAGSVGQRSLRDCIGSRQASLEKAARFASAHLDLRPQIHKGDLDNGGPQSGKANRRTPFRIAMRQFDTAAEKCGLDPGPSRSVAPSAARSFTLPAGEDG